MTDIRNITPTNIGLRAYDTAIGFRNLDDRNAILADFSSTHTIGMAAVLAGAIKGQDVIKDARSLKRLAAEILKISHWAFDIVVQELEDLEMIRNIQRRGGDIVSFVENVPLFYDNVHERLGTRWLDRHPSELEAQFLSSLNMLAQTPLPAQNLFQDLGIDTKADKKLRIIGENAELIRYYSLSDGTEIATSPLHAFEHPDHLVTLFENHSPDRVREAFSKVRKQIGFPILMDNTYPVIEDMVKLGLVPAPTVVGADQKDRSFAMMLYGLDPVFLTSKKQILDKALALIACVRCGEVSGGRTSIRMPESLLAALTNSSKNYTLGGHSSAPRQYAPLIRMHMITLVQQGNLWGARLVPTPDNIEAVNLACTLLKRRGEGVPERGNEREAAKLLFTGGDYLAPFETIALTRRKAPFMNQTEVMKLWEKAAFGGL